MRKIARKSLFLVLVTSVALIWWFCQDFSATAQAGAEPLPPTCVDINKDGGTDISDAVHLLNWLFIGGPAPKVCVAQPTDLEARVSALEEWRGSQDLGRNVAGTYIGIAGRHRVLLTLNPGGTYTLSTQLTFGWPAEVDGRTMSTVHGIWTKGQGDREISMCDYFFSFDPDGTPVANNREFATVQFDEEFIRGNGNLTIEFFFDPGVDPQDEEPDDSINFDVSFRRISCN